MYLLVIMFQEHASLVDYRKQEYTDRFEKNTEDSRSTGTLTGITSFYYMTPASVQIMHIGLVPEPVVIDAWHTKAGALTATEQLLPSTWFICTTIEAHS